LGLVVQNEEFILNTNGADEQKKREEFHDVMLMMCSFDVACSRFGVLFCFAPNEGGTRNYRNPLFSNFNADVVAVVIHDLYVIDSSIPSESIQARKLTGTVQTVALL
jgi:hypothetical protein